MNGLFNLMMAHPAFGQRFRPMQGQAWHPRGQMQQAGGYDSSGINPGGGPLPMGGMPQMPHPQLPHMKWQHQLFPANPGGFMPMGGFFQR
jgi:hypothetical protein